MRIPQRPPTIHDLTQLISAGGDPSRFLKLLGRKKIVDEKGRYLHWDDLRRKTNDDGLTPEEGWFATRMARISAAQSVPLLDISGRNFSYCEPPCLKAVLRFVDLNAGGLLGTEEQTLTPGDGRRYFTRSLAEEPFASSFIEGAATTRQRAKQMIFDQRAPRTTDELMVLNNYKGMEYIKSVIDKPLTVETILETHRIITQGALRTSEDSGRLRKTDDVFVYDETDEILHVPPPCETLSDRMRMICEFANASDAPGSFIHPILRAIILHFALAYDHPFVDGNGRTARALFYWSALKAGYWLIEYVSISSVIAEAKTKYGRAFLETETDEGDLTYFLVHQTDVLRTAIERLMAYAQRKKEEANAFQQHVLSEDSEFNKRQSSLLFDAVRNRIAYTTISEHEQRNKVSRLTARSDLEELVRLGLFKKRRRGRENLYVPVTDIAARFAVRGQM